jgi:hypothetical protein
MANSLYLRGLRIAGDRITCTVSYVHDALGADCEALLNEQVDKPDAVTHQELQETERRMLQRLSK